MSTIDDSAVIVLILSVVGALLLGVVIVAVVELANRGAGNARQLLDRLNLRVPAASGEAAQAQALRTAMRREVARTADAVHHAASRGVPVGELRQVVGEIAGQATRLDEQPGIAAGQPGAAFLAQLRDHHDKLTQVCAGIRADLVDGELRQSSAELGETLRRAEIEIEALRAAKDAYDELYRGQIGNHPESSER